MQMRYRYRIEPTPAQQAMLARVFGCCRVVFNDALRVRGEAYRAGIKLSDSEIQRRVITAAKTTERAGWLCRGAQCGVGAVGQRLPAGLAQLLRLATGKRKGRQGGPAADEVAQGSSAVVSAHPQRIQRSATQRPVVCGEGRRGAGALVARAAQRNRRRSRSSANPTGTTTPASSSTSPRRRCRRCSARPGWMWASRGWRRSPPPTDRRLDVANPKHLGRKLRKLRRLEREKSRRQKGSTNRDKTRRKVAIAHGKVARARRDYHHKQALALVRENQVIHVEDLNIVGMVKNRRLARAISDAGWGQFVRIIGEKADRYGRTVHTVSRWLASSKTCLLTGLTPDTPDERACGSLAGL